MAIPLIYQTDGNMITSPQGIVDEFARYYGQLYDGHKTIHSQTTVQDTHSFLRDAHLPGISEKDREVLNATISPAEVIQVIKELKVGKAVGPDGFPGDYYKLFRTTLLTHITKFCNHLLEVVMSADLNFRYCSRTAIEFHRQANFKTYKDSFWPQ